MKTVNNFEMLRFNYKIKNKENEPRLYNIIMDRQGDFQYLWTGISYTLEEAIAKTKIAMLTVGHFSVEQVIESVLAMHNSFTLNDIDKMLIDSDCVEISCNLDKFKSTDSVMLEILKTKDKELFEKYKNVLNNNERKYIISKLDEESK